MILLLKELFEILYKYILKTARAKKKRLYP